MYVVYLGTTPLPVRVTTRIIIFLVGDPHKPSFPLLLGGETTQRIPIKNQACQNPVASPNVPRFRIPKEKNDAAETEVSLGWVGLKGCHVDGPFNDEKAGFGKMFFWLGDCPEKFADFMLAIFCWCPSKF